jgi:hypothetical protein
MVLIDKDDITFLAIKHKLLSGSTSFENIDDFVNELEIIFRNKTIELVNLEGMAKKDIVRVLSCQHG